MLWLFVGVVWVYVGKRGLHASSHVFDDIATPGNQQKNLSTNQWTHGPTDEQTLLSRYEDESDQHPL